MQLILIAVIYLHFLVVEIATLMNELTFSDCVSVMDAVNLKRSIKRQGQLTSVLGKGNIGKVNQVKKSAIGFKIVSR